MDVFYLISVLSILITFVVPCTIGIRYMTKHGTFRFFGYYCYGGFVVCMLYNKDN